MTFKLTLENFKKLKPELNGGVFWKVDEKNNDIILIRQAHFDEEIKLLLEKYSIE